MLLRLIGVRLSGLVHGNHQISMFDDTEESISLYERIDHIKHRFGSDKIMRATTIDVSKRVRMELNMFKG
jgi:DNA polymerase-4